mmetsp:Transcript_11019/g.17051  ORF Transcript_11019/g.17051 Transcript_11019/m.17051 type:complete len:641 (+) Transcript_11019:68-1990(+)
MDVALDQKQVKVETKLCDSRMVVHNNNDDDYDVTDIDIKASSNKAFHNDIACNPDENFDEFSVICDQELDNDWIQSSGSKEWQISPLSGPLFKDLPEDQDTKVQTQHYKIPTFDDLTVNTMDNNNGDEWYDLSSPYTQCGDANAVTVTSDEANSTLSSSVTNLAAKELLLIPKDEVDVKPSVSMDAVTQARMEQMVHLQKPSTNEIGWVPWSAKGEPKSLDHHDGKVYFPVLVLSPFLFEPHVEIRRAWNDMFYQSVLEEQKKAVDKIIVYFYKSDDPNGAFSLANLANFVPFEEGVRRGYDRPMRLYTKVDDGVSLTRAEKKFLLGLDRIVEDSTKPGDLRGGPMFFSNMKTRVTEKEWVQCDSCEKWHILPSHVHFVDLPGLWDCTMNTWDDRNMCSASSRKKNSGDTREMHETETGNGHTAPETFAQQRAVQGQVNVLADACESCASSKSSRKEVPEQIKSTGKKKKRVLPERKQHDRAAKSGNADSSKIKSAKIYSVSDRSSINVDRKVALGRTDLGSVNNFLFDKLVWNVLEKDGWRFEHGSRSGDSYLYPPGVRRDRGTFRNRVHFFNSRVQVLDAIAKDERWKKKPNIIEARNLYFECKDKISELKSKNKLPKGKVKKKWLLRQLEELQKSTS